MPGDEKGEAECLADWSTSITFDLHIAGVPQTEQQRNEAIHPSVVDSARELWVSHGATEPRVRHGATEKDMEPRASHGAMDEPRSHG